MKLWTEYGRPASSAPAGQSRQMEINLFLKRNAFESENHRQQNYESNQNDVTEIADPARQGNFPGNNFAQQILEKPKRTGPAANKRTAGRADKQQQTDQQIGHFPNRRQQRRVIRRHAQPGRQTTRADTSNNGTRIPECRAATGPLARATRRENRFAPRDGGATACGRVRQTDAAGNLAQNIP